MAFNTVFTIIHVTQNMYYTDELKDFTDDEKLEKSDDFAEQYEGKSDEFIQFNFR